MSVVERNAITQLLASTPVLELCDDNKVRLRLWIQQNWYGSTWDGVKRLKIQLNYPERDDVQFAACDFLWPQDPALRIKLPNLNTLVVSTDIPSSRVEEWGVEAATMLDCFTFSPNVSVLLEIKSPTDAAPSITDLENAINKAYTERYSKPYFPEAAEQ
jgi:hypothetical protein